MQVSSRSPRKDPPLGDDFFRKLYFKEQKDRGAKKAARIAQQAADNNVAADPEPAGANMAVVLHTVQSPAGAAPKPKYHPTDRRHCKLLGLGPSCPSLLLLRTEPPTPQVERQVMRYRSTHLRGHAVGHLLGLGDCLHLIVVDPNLLQCDTKTI